MNLFLVGVTIGLGFGLIIGVLTMYLYTDNETEYYVKVPMGGRVIINTNPQIEVTRTDR